jgi:nitroimidazol reductase NimA-like FMN-containing flavoprotein (pyridoxamine 5'-phosphate oxidase superfamily)
LTAAESLALLGSVPLGRIGFTSKALPVIRPVNHIVDDGSIVIRSHEGAAIMSAAHPAEGAVVAYEAEAIDLAGHLGWSVVVTGVARLVTDPDEVARYRRLLRLWADGKADDVIRISPELVTGLRLTGANGDGAQGDEKADPAFADPRSGGPRHTAACP